MIKPSWPDGNITLGRCPLRSVFIPFVQQLFYTRLSGVQCIWRNRTPIGFPRLSPFITCPTYSRSGITEENNFRIHPPNQVQGGRPIVICATIYFSCLTLASVKAIPAVGPIKPHLEDVRILCE